jgi:tRNA nucleotidyltransferase (CCA-adding enzyme)
LVIDLDDMIQVVARSTTDDVDVGAMMRDLGGGGHSRAAAAPVHGMDSTVAVRDRIAELIRAHSRSAVTVRNIMSYGRPQTLTPDMTINAAYELMRRYGHEGFPVYEQRADGSESLLGVLTRREADRAVSHNLGAEPVSRFMRAGSVVVRPEDSISTLRQTMIDTNWGQIPVVNDQGNIIGIVTRTDLIKLWDEATLPEHGATELATRLRETLSPVQHYLLELVGRKVDEMDFTVYIVGGFTRDLLLNSELQRRVATLDMDVVIEGDAIAFAHHMQNQYGGRVVPHRRFRTAKWLLDDPGFPLDADRLFEGLDEPVDIAALPANFDFVTARTEFYTAPTVLPTVESSSIKLDLHRRDFTINTLALCLNPDRWGELLDFYGGLHDLDEGVIRVLHSLSFVDDPTRILRAVRYEQRFGFTIAPRTLVLLDDALDMLDRVSPARLRHELERILHEVKPERALCRLDELGVLAHIHPELIADQWMKRKFGELRAALLKAEPDPALSAEPIERLYWGIMTYRQPAGVDEALVERLGLRGETQRLVESLETLRQRLSELSQPDLRPSQIARLLDGTTPTARALTQILCEDEAIVDLLRRYDAEWRDVRPHLDGRDLAALGLPTGPLYGAILRDLRAARLDGEIDSREDELERLAIIVDEQGYTLSDN